MNNIHPVMAQALNPFAPPAPMSVYRVSIRMSADGREVYLQAPNTCSAISRAIELLLDDGDEVPADGIVISARVVK